MDSLNADTKIRRTGYHGRVTHPSNPDLAPRRTRLGEAMLNSFHYEPPQTPDYRSAIFDILKGPLACEFSSQSHQDHHIASSDRINEGVARRTIESLTAENQQLRTENDALRSENATLFVKQFEADLRGRMLSDEIATMRGELVRYGWKPSDSLNSIAGYSSSAESFGTTKQRLPTIPVLTGVPLMTRKGPNPTLQESQSSPRFPSVKNVYRPPLQISIPACFEGASKLRSSAHFPPPVLKATCQPYRRVKSPKELCARRDTLEPVDVIDLTGDDDESEPWVQTVPRKKRRLRDHHQSISSTLRDIRLDSSTPLATFSTEDPSTEYSTQNFTVDSSPGSSVTLVDHPTEADILGFCIRNAFEKADDDTKVWCRMCKCRYEMSESLGVKPPLPIAFPFEEFDALVNHCKDEHPTGWGELRVSVLQSIRMA